MTDTRNLSLATIFERTIDMRWLLSLIDAARIEDMGRRGDVTSAACIDPERRAVARVVSRAGGRLAGAPLIGLVAKRYDPAIDVTLHRHDGDELTPDDAVAELAGPLRSVLAAERVVLNFVTHLSGIATLTSQYVEAVAHTNAGIYDTRKTLPGFRGLAKYAVRCGGGHGHRMGLHDAMLIKDNHIAGATDLATAVSEAVARARTLQPAPAFIEVEVDTLDQLGAVLTTGIDIVLLDNMTTDKLRQAVALRDDQAPDVQLEASGGVHLDTVAAIAETGVDRISVGALTHSAPALDLGLDID